MKNIYKKIKQLKFRLYQNYDTFCNKIYYNLNNSSFQKLYLITMLTFLKKGAREGHEVIFPYIAVLWLVIFWKMKETFSLILSRKGSARFKWSPEKCFHCFSCDMERGFRELCFWCGPSWQFLEIGNFSSESPVVSKTMRKSLGQSILYYKQYFFILLHNEFIWFITFWSLTSRNLWSSERFIKHPNNHPNRCTAGPQSLI